MSGRQHQFGVKQPVSRSRARRALLGASALVGASVDQRALPEPLQRPRRVSVPAAGQVPWIAHSDAPLPLGCFLGWLFKIGLIVGLVLGVPTLLSGHL